MVYLLLHSNDVGYIFTQIVRGGGGVWAGFPPAGVSQDAVPHPEDPGS